MDKYVVFVLAVFLSPSIALPPSQTKQYRTDYTYNEKNDAFYKLHIENGRGWNVQDTCKLEGAVLMVPTTQRDLIQLHSMFKRFPDLGNYVWVGQDGQTHESAEEQPMIDLSSNDESSTATPWNNECDVVNRQGDIESFPCYQQLPFICKVQARDAPYDSRCDVYGNNYQYVPSVGSCYKIPRFSCTWNQAYAECQAEGAHLVVINSEAEHLIVKNITNTEAKVLGAKTHWFFFAGFRSEGANGENPRVFKTIFNQTLEEAGYSQWSPNEPNNFENKENCGSIFKNDGYLNDVNCVDEYAFICEKELHT